MEDLRELLTADMEASNVLQKRIDRAREDLTNGEPASIHEREVMNSDLRSIIKELDRRIEKVESQVCLTPADREVLQGLNARLVVCDRQTMQLAELNDIAEERAGKKRRPFLEAEEKPVTALPVDNKQPPGEFEVIPRAAVDKESNGEENGDRPRDVESINSSPCYSSDDDCHYSDEEEEKPRWPLLYQIMDVAPYRPNNDTFSNDLIVAKRKLAMKHDPSKVPNDAGAAIRWAAIEQAYGVLSDPERKTFYDLQQRTPAALEGFSMSTLCIED